MPENQSIDAVQNALGGIVHINFLNRDNCVITEKNGFIGLRAIIKKPEELIPTDDKSGDKKPETSKADNKSDGKPDDTADSKPDEKPTEPSPFTEIPEGMIEKVAERIFLSRAFPFDMPFEYISVLDKDSKEYGIIRRISDFDEESAAIIRAELARKYFAPHITKINSLKERFGYSYWEVESDRGPLSIS